MVALSALSPGYRQAPGLSIANSEKATLLSVKLTACILKDSFLSAEYPTPLVGLKRLISLAKGFRGSNSLFIRRESGWCLSGYVCSCGHRSAQLEARRVTIRSVNNSPVGKEY
jgi:hypothetical protein